MNYETLFPKILKQLPALDESDMCYHYQKKYNDNKHMHLYIPSGKKVFLWFLKYNHQNYGVVLEYDQYKKEIHKCNFHYLSFKPELTCGCGTLITCIKVNRELCLLKLVFYMGVRYSAPCVGAHMKELKSILENYIHPLSPESFVSLRLPVMNDDKQLVLGATSLSYMVYSIMSFTNYQIILHGFCANFQLRCEDVKKGIFTLQVKNNQNELVSYGSACVNDIKTTYLCRSIFLNKTKTYLSIEYSDDEGEYSDCENAKSKEVTMMCIFIPSLRKWKPYKKTHKHVDTVQKIKFIENKKYGIYI